MSKLIDLTGKTFGRLTVISRGPNTEDQKATWLCLCSCGNNHYSTTNSLKQEHTKSCGCFRRDIIGERVIKHGQSHTKEYKAWKGMIRRCYNEEQNGYKNYGGRGIIVCEGWINSFEVFLMDVGNSPSKHHSIDRKNNNGNYEPDNVKWSTRKEQQNNKRSTVTVTINGQTNSIKLWCDIFGTSYKAVKARIYRGWDAANAIITPLKIPIRSIPKGSQTLGTPLKNSEN